MFIRHQRQKQAKTRAHLHHTHIHTTYHNKRRTRLLKLDYSEDKADKMLLKLRCPVNTVSGHERSASNMLRNC